MFVRVNKTDVVNLLNVSYVRGISDGVDVVCHMNDGSVYQVESDCVSSMKRKMETINSAIKRMTY